MRNICIYRVNYPYQFHSFCWAVSSCGHKSLAAVEMIISVPEVHALYKLRPKSHKQTVEYNTTELWLFSGRLLGFPKARPANCSQNQEGRTNSHLKYIPRGFCFVLFAVQLTCKTFSITNFSATQKRGKSKQQPEINKAQPKLVSKIIIFRLWYCCIFIYMTNAHKNSLDKRFSSWVRHDSGNYKYLLVSCFP